MMWDSAAIAAATGGEVLRDAAEGVVWTDTRNLPAQVWYLALRGARFDGHDFLGAALHTVGCVVEREPSAAWQGGVVRVSDTTRALQDLGRAARRRLTGEVIALTGSSGKTTTRSLIAAALAPMGEVHQTTGNLNNHLGVPMTLLAAPEGAAAVVLEMGTSSPGEIAVLADIAQPRVRVVINVGPAHLQELGGLAGVAVEKGALFASARPGDIAVVNADDPWVSKMPIPEGVRVVTWGRRADVDIRLLEAGVDPDRLETTGVYQTPQGRVRARLAAPGEHVAHDGGAALAVAWALGLDLARAAEAMEAWQPVGMRLRREALPCGAVALNDSYNANPASMRSSLRTLAGLPGERVAVIGDMLELGAMEVELHRDLLRDALALGLDRVVPVGPRMALAAEALGVEAFTDPLLAIPSLRAGLRAGQIMLLKASRGTRLERVLQSLQAEVSPCSTI